MAQKLSTPKGAKFKLEEINLLFPACIKKDGNIEDFFEICTDSREINENQIFLPIKGERFDGHDFINKSFKRGVKFSFCERGSLDKVEENFQSKLIIVDDTLNSYHKIANYFRRKINPKVIAVTGSAGKTTTKDMLEKVLSKKYKTHKTKKNFNNEIGVPKTILEMSEDTKVLILELAMRKEGEIKLLSQITEPDIALITNIGSAHIGRLGKKEDIARAKSEVVDYLNTGGLLVACEDEHLQKFINEKWKGKIEKFSLKMASKINFKEGKTRFELGGKIFEIPATGKQFILSAISSIIIAEHLNLRHEEIQQGLSEFQVPKGRGNVIKTDAGNYVIDESYNASPDTLKQAVDNLIESYDSGFKKVLVLGELAELGEGEKPLLLDLREYIDNLPIDLVITIGRQFKDQNWKIQSVNVEDIKGCCMTLNKILKEKSVVLVKGSRVSGLEKVVEYLCGNSNTNE